MAHLTIIALYLGNEELSYAEGDSSAYADVMLECVAGIPRMYPEDDVTMVAKVEGHCMEVTTPLSIWRMFAHK